MQDLMILAPIGAVVSLLFAVFLSWKVKQFSTGTELMTKISKAIKTGAKAYLKRQYSGVGIFFAGMFVVLLLLAFVFVDKEGKGLLNPFVPFAFLTGGFFSGMSGFIGMSMNQIILFLTAVNISLKKSVC
jgi:K(+)-stimulated pyrophosphate-energized sodium pump